MKGENKSKRVKIDWHDHGWSMPMSDFDPKSFKKNSRRTRSMPAPAAAALFTDTMTGTHGSSPADSHFLAVPSAACNLLPAHTMKTKSCSSNRSRAFTLIELLVVIAIIAILAALLLPAINRVKLQTLKKNALLDMGNIATAVHNYESEYSRMPVSKKVSDTAAANQADFTYGTVNTGARFTVQNNFAKATWDTNNAEIVWVLMDMTNNYVNPGYLKNPKRTAYLNPNMTGTNQTHGVDANGVYRDPWNQPYIITVDLNNDDNTRDAFYSSTIVSDAGTSPASGFNGLIPIPAGTPNYYELHSAVMVWSAGPDQQIDTGNKANLGLNKDNLLSWKQ
jgi:prepilin-type N-terminal cleavage/methylation domain-containing protein